MQILSERLTGEPDEVPDKNLAVVERLEARIAPAILLSSKTVSYVDPDGDTVLIESSKAIFAEGLAGLQFAAEGLGEQLQKWDLGLLAKGANLKISVTTPGGSSDGVANVGFINAAGIDLGTVRVDGDLGRIHAGDGVASTGAIKSLSVGSLGVKGLTTQAAGGNLQSTLLGALRTLTVEGDIDGATLNIGGGSYGKLTSAVIGGSVIGQAADNSGKIATSGTMGVVQIGGDLEGGGGTGSGALVAGGKITRIWISGSLLGNGDASGQVRSGPALDYEVYFNRTSVSGGGLTELHVVGDIRGGDGDRSGNVEIGGAIGLYRVGGSVVGGEGEWSGGSYLAAAVTEIRVGGDLQGAAGEHSGSLFRRHYQSGSVSSKITVGGSVLGGEGSQSGNLEGSAQIVAIGGDVVGDLGFGSGRVSVTANKSFHLSGSVLGGSGDSSGVVSVQGKGKVWGDVVVGTAGSGPQQTASSSGVVSIVYNPEVFIGGDIVGGAASGGMLGANYAGKITIGGDVQGGSANYSGYIRLETVKQFTLGGSLIGGHALASGHISASATSLIEIGGNLENVWTDGSAQFDKVSGGIDYSFSRSSDSIVIHGSITTAAGPGGDGDRGSAAVIFGRLARLEIGGSIVGHEDNRAGIYTFNRDQFPVVKGVVDSPNVLNSLEVGGRVEWAEIASAQPESSPSLVARQIGSVLVGGDWIASTLAIGVDAGTDGVFGNLDDTLFAKANKPAPSAAQGIAKIVIGGRVLGSADPSDVFAFTASRIGSMTVGGRVLSLTGGIDDLVLSTGTGNDVRVVELLS